MHQIPRQLVIKTASDDNNNNSTFSLYSRVSKEYDTPVSGVLDDNSNDEDTSNSGVNNKGDVNTSN